MRAALLDNHLTHLPPGLAVALADLYEMDPQAHAALLLALTRVPPADVAVFLAEDLESFSAALEREHDLAPKILVAWEWALVSRRPFETLGEIARRLTSERYVRDLRRSLNRDVLRAMQRGADPAGPINDRPGETFRARLQKAFWWLLYYGSDYRRDRNPLEYEFIARQAAARLSARAPAFAFREHGVAGVLTRWLYAQSAMERMVVPYRNIEPLDMNARQRFGRDRASGGTRDNTRRRVDADNLRGSAPQQSHAPSGQPTPEPTQSPSLLQHIEAFADAVISQAGFAVQSAWEMPLPFDPLRMPQTQAAPLGRSQVLASRIRAERARKDAVGNLKTDVNPLSPSAASRRLGPVITAQFFRMHAQDKLRQTLAPLLDIKRFLANRFKDGSYPLAANLNPDGWFLKRFTLWQYHPDRDAFTRHQSAQQGALYSKSLTQAALDIFTIDPPFDNLREEYGIYARNRTGSTIFEPAEELKGMSAEQFVEISRQAKKEFHRRRLALEQVTPGELAALDLRAHRITMLEQDASLAYFAGKLSSRAHALVQTICYAPSQPMRDAADSFIHEIQGYELEIEVPGAGPRHYPAGAFVIGIPSTGMARRPASIVLHLAGHTDPLIEYASTSHFLDDVARGNSSSVHRALVDRLPLHLQDACRRGAQCKVSMKPTRDDLFDLTTQSSFEVVRDDVNLGGQRLLENLLGHAQDSAGSRTRHWLTWFAGAEGDAPGTAQRPPAGVVSGFPNNRPPGAISPGRQISLPASAVTDFLLLTHLRAHLSAVLPTPEASARTYLAGIFDSVTPRVSAPERLFLHIESRDTLPPEVPHVVSSRLDKLVLDVVAGKPPLIYGRTHAYFSHSPNPKHANAVVRFEGFAPQDLLGRIDVKAFEKCFLDDVKTFWTHHRSEVRASLKGAFLIDVYLQTGDGKLSANGASIARTLVGIDSPVPSGVSTPLNLDARYLETEYTPPMSALKMARLQIEGKVSDIHEFTDPKTGAILVYAPSFLANSVAAFPDRAALARWIVRICQDKAARERLARTFGPAANPANAQLSGNATIEETLAQWGRPGAGVPAVMPPGRPFDAGNKDAFTEYTRTWEAHSQYLIQHAGARPQTNAFASLLNWSAVLNVVVGVGHLAFSAAPFIGQANAAITGFNVVAGTMGAVFGDEATNQAGWAALLTGVTGGIPLGLLARSSEAFRGFIGHFAARESESALSNLLPNLYRGPQGMVARIDEQLVNVRYDTQRGRWRMFSSDSPDIEGPAIRQTGTYDWFLVESDTSTADDAVMAEPFHDQIRRDIDVRFRSALASENSPAGMRRREQLGAGQTRPLTPTPTPKTQQSDLLKLEYIKSNDPAVRATLLKQIRTQEGVELSLRAKVAARWFGQEVDDLGGEFIEFAQADFLHTTTDGSQGLCLAFARAMAIAIDEARVSSLIMNVQSAVDTPSAPVAKALRDALTSLQMNPGASATESHLEFLDFEAISDKLLNTQTRGTFLVQTMSHAMTLVLNDVSAFFDPNFGLGRFASREALVEFLRTHLGKSALLKRYGAYGTPMTPSFAFKQVDIDALRDVPLTAPGFAKTADLLRPWTEPAV
ncbi:hypothetical protein AB870_19845 [Pandoraea faecigallinarum]|uniref:Dermonecrotic toxin N-terminal domain-containing protein n=1 Tax=Pandoraea faecigallinarum TaxID=656179 RepID=A0A0H3WZB3_9BURK|nr:hypothetical protein AB870_19845 [Pandoraea faecigallinarum]